MLNTISSALVPFCPITKWAPDETARTWSISGVDVPMYIIDERTGDKYLNQAPCITRIKCGAAFLAGFLVHPIAILINLMFRIVRVVALFEFLIRSRNWSHIDSKEVAIDLGKNLLRVVAFPVILPLLEIAALYGILRPNDGKKVYASIEAAFYGRGVLCVCFQPNTVQHTFGGDINNPYAW